MYVFVTKESEVPEQNIKGNSSFRTRTFSKLARSHIHRCFSILVFYRYTVFFTIAQVIKGNCID